MTKKSLGRNGYWKPEQHNKAAGKTDDTTVESLECVKMVGFVVNKLGEENNKGENVSIRGEEETTDEKRMAQNQDAEDVMRRIQEGSGNDLKEIHNSSSVPPQLPSPPKATDRGYAWVVVTVVFCINVLAAGYIKSFGILYIFVVEYFPNTSGAQAGWIVGLLVGTRGLLSPIMAALTVVIGPRKCIIAGSLLIVIGLTAAIPSFSIFYMAVTLGGIVGVGICLSETPGYLEVTNYFHEKRALANGIRAAGNPMGGFIFPILVVFLHQEFSLKGTFLLMAGIMMQIVVLGFLMRPFDQHEIIIREKYKQNMRNEFGISLGNINLKNENDTTTKIKKKPLNFSYLINPAYLVYIFSALCASLALPNAFLYTPLHCNLIGLSIYEISLVTAYMSGSDFFLRLLCGWIANKNYIKRSNFFIIGFLLGAVGCITIPLCTNLWQVLMAVTLLSFCMALFWTLLVTLLADHFGTDDIPTTYGFFRMTLGLSNFFYPTMLGKLYDMTGSMVVPYMVMGGALILAAVIFALLPIVAKLFKVKITLG